MEASTRKLRDTSPSTRLAALETLRNLAKENCYDGDLRHTLVLEAVGNPYEEVRVALFDYLGRVYRFGDCLKLLEGLEDPLAKVRAAAFQWLGTGTQGTRFLWRKRLKPKFLEGLDDPDSDVRKAAFQSLSNFSSCAYEIDEDTWKFKLKLAKGREDPVEKVRRAACKASEKFKLSWDLDEFIVEQIKGLESHWPDVRDAASQVLCNLSSIWRYSAEIVSKLDFHWRFAPQHVQERSLYASTYRLFKVPIEDESEECDTWLHIAARCGCSIVCQALLANGLAMKSLRNAKRQTASDVARLNGHADLAGFLSLSTFQTRGGSGGAIAKALDSGDVVEEVSWWFIPLPGWGGTLGAAHSILKIDTGKDQYLIEGTCPEKVKPEGVQRPEIEKASENGLFISSWAEIKDAANVERLTDVKPCQSCGIVLTALVKHLLQQGPYNVGSNNCHHTAFHGYNFCAAKPLRRLPVNAGLTSVAWILAKVNVDLAESRSCGKPLPSKPMYAGIPRDENVTLELPRHWTGQVQDGAVDLDRGSDEFLKVEAYLNENGGDKIPGFQIIDIKRNQNLKMLRTFRNELYDMHGQRQLRLFHSASNGDVHDKVMKEGFKMAYSNMDFNAYGAGIYFAQDLRLPDYFFPKSDAGVKQTLLCCVAAGKSYVKKRIFEFVPGDRLSGRSEDQWREELRKPEHRQAPDGYDSCIADPEKEALIVYRESQVLWEYAIQYQSTGSAGHPYGHLRGLLKEVPQS